MTEKGYISDLYKQLNEVMNKCDNLSLQVKNIKKETENKYKLEIKNLKREHREEINVLNHKIKKLENENEMLKNENDRLRKQLNNNNSNNSSKPPSSDIKPNRKDIPNNRKNTDKKVDGQIGHKGTHLSKKYVEYNVHVTRYLKGNHENTSHSWDIEMIEFLNDLNTKKKELILNNINSFTQDKLNYYLNKYDEIISKVKEENKKENSTYYKAEEKSLINRLEKYKENHLMFILDFDMPFDNNMSKRELRHVKLKQKVSGFFNFLESI